MATLEIVRSRCGDFSRGSGAPELAFCVGSSVSPAPIDVSSVSGGIPLRKPPVLGWTAAAL